MGEAYDRTGAFLGAAQAETKRQVFDELMKRYPSAAEIRIRTLHGEGAPSTEMPRYRSHKVVHALKIAAIVDPTEPGNESDGSRLITPADPGYGAFAVDAAYMRKHTPTVGGYYIVYDDGYKSFSPAAAFEAGYTRI